MNRTLLLMAVAAVATSGVKAQSVTYNHDSPKQNQITVMETGTGALSPELYYTLLHNKYKKSAASKNKLSFRTLAGPPVRGARPVPPHGKNRESARQRPGPLHQKPHH